MKRCPKCKTAHPFAEFFKNKARPDGLSTWCKECMNKDNRARWKSKGYNYNSSHYQRRKNTMWEYQLQRKFGLAKEQYEKLLAWSQGGCAICGVRPDAHWRRLGVDHNHVTGQVRGLLCHDCNIGIAKFKDDPRLLQIAGAYLRFFSDKA